MYTYNEEKKANRIGHIMRRNCVLKQVIIGTIEEWRIEVMGRRGRRRKKLLGHLQRKRVLEIKKRKQQTALGGEPASQRCYGHVVRQTAELRFPHSPAYLHGELIWTQVPSDLRPVTITPVNTPEYPWNSLLSEKSRIGRRTSITWTFSP
jgi:hypothetical protein